MLVKSQMILVKILKDFVKNLTGYWSKSVNILAQIRDGFGKNLLVKILNDFGQNRKRFWLISFGQNPRGFWPEY